MSDYSHPPEGEIYKGIHRDVSAAWAGWRYVDRAKAVSVQCPGLYGTREYENWAAYISKLLSEMPSLQTLVEQYHKRKSTE